MKMTAFNSVRLGTKKIWKILLPVFLISAMLVSSVIIVMPVLAASLTGVSDNLTNYQTSQNANHTIVFTTATGSSFGATNHVTISFPSGFNIAGATVASFEYYSSGSWTDLLFSSSISGQSVTITRTGAGAISGGSRMRVIIDTIMNPSASGNYTVNLTTNDSNNDTGSAGVTIIAPLPTVTAVSPSAGPLAGGTNVAITGTNFTGATAVQFGGTNATSFTFNSATSITAISPAGSAGTVDITVTTALGTSATNSADHFTYAAAPTVSSISPTSGLITGGTRVMITGTNFTGVTVVQFGGTNAANYIVNSAISITATSPAGSAGTVDITVTAAGGTNVVSSADQFTYAAGPTVTAVSPSAGPLAGETSVAITGTNFTGVTAVKFGGTNATNYIVNSTTSITATSPAHSAGTVDITVTTALGISATSSADQFSYAAGPTVTAVSPSAGPLAGGTSVTITGTNFTGVTAVKFGGTNATNYIVNSATSITATSPAGSAGTVDITVTTALGISATSSADQFSYAAGSTVAAVSPSTGPLAGGTSVTITGTNFTGVTAVKFGGTNATNYIVNSATSITATSPAGSAGTVDITVTTALGISATSSADQFTYAASPTVSFITPTSGPTAGGTSVTITGTGFTSGATVKVGGTLATGVSVVSATSITVVTPAGTAGAQDVVVTNPDNQYGTLTGGFTYVAPAPVGGGGGGGGFIYVPLAPTVANISPTSGSTAGGTSVTITGTGFASGATMTIGGITATGISVVSATSITATIPPGTAGAQDVVVTNPGNQSGTMAKAFTYVLPAPAIVNISPTSGPVAGGTSVTITGTGFASGATVTIGGTAATGVNVVSATSITVTIPPGTAGAQDVVVTNVGNQFGTMARGFTYVPPAPTVASISPASGPTAGGTSVTITGTGFASGATVMIGGAAATGVSVVGTTSITATIPPGTAGAQDVVVTNPDNQLATMAKGFSYETPAPAGQTAVSQFVTGNGNFTQAVTVSSVDTAVVLTIAQDIQGLANNAKPLSYISITPMKVPPSQPPGQSVVGMAYNVGPEGATFNKPVTLTFHYDPNQLPAGANNNNLTIAVWDLTNNSWVGITSVVDPAAHTVTAQVTHFSGYVVLIPSRPAAFAVSNLSINPLNINVGMVVTISAVVTNKGDLNGNYHVSLKINNVQVDAKDVTLAGNASQTVVFSTATNNTAGNYIIDVNGEVSAFTVKAVSATTSDRWILIVGVIAFVAGVCLAVSREVIRKRRKSAQLPE